MNFLFNALVIILLLLPGVILRISYLNIIYGKKTFRSSFAEELLLSLVPTFVIQSMGFLLLKKKIDFTTFYLLLINSDKAVSDNHLNQNSITGFLLYCFGVYLFSWLLGSLFRRIAVIYSWDIRIPLFRLHNEWYYHLQGFIEETEKGEKYFTKIDNVWLDVLMDNKDASYIYSGWLYEFTLSKEEGLHFICLNGVRRRKLNDDKPDVVNKTEKIEEAEFVNKSDELRIEYEENNSPDNSSQTDIENIIDKRYYNMPGENFIIPYSEIKNINIIYFREES